jgi:DNA mismatch repair protein MutL
MDNIIQLLPDHVANQIAAGEVVQRASSVVKELLENAIDAKANAIQLVVKEAGRTLIQVIDNGIGMSMIDAKMAFERHATSKIRNSQDIFSITTNGFRGEALASIAAVSQVELKTKRNEDVVGTILHIESNEIKKQEPCVIQHCGSSFSVKNLFYNVPARRNFLKSNPIELKHIIDEFLRVAIPNPNLEFSLIHNDAVLYSLKKKQSKQRIIDIFGDRLNEQLIPVKEKTDIIEIEGFVCKPERAKKNKKEQFFFVNNRFIRSPYLNKAILDAFSNLISTDYYPSYFIFITIPPHKIDVNIHPTKTEIKFEDDFAIFAILKAAVRHALGLFNVMPSIDFEQNYNLHPSIYSKPNQSISAPQIRVNPNYNPFKPDSFSTNSTIPKGQSQWITENYKEEKSAAIFSSMDFKISDKKDFSAIQFQQSYLVVELNGDLVLIDQHRAHQKILFEKFFASFDQQKTTSEPLLFPIEIELSADEIEHFALIDDFLHQVGFDFVLYSGSIQINSLPNLISKEQIDKLFHDILSIENKENLTHETLKILSKSAAIKKGKKLSNEEINQLLQDLFSLNEYNFSPYGKPIFIHLTLENIQKKFN